MQNQFGNLNGNFWFWLHSVASYMHQKGTVSNRRAENAYKHMPKHLRVVLGKCYKAAHGISRLTRYDKINIVYEFMAGTLTVTDVSYAYKGQVQSNG